MRRLGVVGILLGLVVGVLPTSAVAQPWWLVPEEENRDLPPGLVAYHEVAPRLRDLERASERVGVEVIGQSLEGRDLYLVTVSDPAARGRFGRYQALRRLMLRDPEAAQRRAAEFDDFKVPVYVHGSIHGDEWEGVDASLDLIERLAFADDAETRAVLDNAVLLFNVVANPDGRVHGMRTNAAGFDLNRDFVTLSQPETRATVEVLTAWNPMVVLDLHGYVDPMLIEPTTPPHNPNYEYDLYIRWALAQAEAMEARVDADVGLPVQIPYRDFDAGWDDWPPIFTPMYAMYHGAYGATLESPMRVNRGAVGLPAEQRRERAQTNKAAHIAAVWGALQFAAENRQDMVHDQMEIFRRGFLGEPQVPLPDDEPDRHKGFLAEFPAAYVVAVGEGQGADLAAARLVDFLRANDVDVERASRPFTAAGRSFATGSYLVPMEQPKRGLANTLLEDGHDISDIIDVMFDISAWSHGLLWGADVARVEDAPEVPSTPVQRAQRPQGEVESGRAGAYGLAVDDRAAIEAANELLAAGVALQRAPDGTIVVPADARTQLQRLAQGGLRFTALADVPAGAEPIAAPRIAVAAFADTRFVLGELGFDFDTITTSDLNAGADLAGYDVLFVGGPAVRWRDLDAVGRATVTGFFEAGGGFVGTGFWGAEFNDGAGVVDVAFVDGPSRANGVANVVNDPDSTITAGYPADDVSFVFDTVWFTDPGADVVVDQRFSDEDALRAGHWIGQDDALGEALVVSADEPTRAVAFGTEPLFRAHPHGLYPQVANALYWTTAAR